MQPLPKNFEIFLDEFKSYKDLSKPKLELFLKDNINWLNFGFNQRSSDLQSLISSLSGRIELLNGYEVYQANFLDLPNDALGLITENLGIREQGILASTCAKLYHLLKPNKELSELHKQTPLMPQLTLTEYLSTYPRSMGNISLDLSHLLLSKEQAIKILRNFPYLTTLGLATNCYGNDLIEVLSHVPKLRSLSLVSVFQKSLDFLHVLPQLRSLSATCNTLNLASETCFSGLISTPLLNHLCLVHLFPRTCLHKNAFVVLSTLKSLITLKLNNIIFPDFTSLAAATQLTTLSAVVLDIGLNTLSSLPSHLENLNLTSIHSHQEFLVNTLPSKLKQISINNRFYKFVGSNPIRLTLSKIMFPENFISLTSASQVGSRPLPSVAKPLLLNGKNLSKKLHERDELPLFVKRPSISDDYTASQEEAEAGTAMDEDLSYE